MKSYLQDLRKLLSTHRAGIKIISSLLVLVLVFFAVPTVVYAEIADAIEDGADSSKDTDENEASYASEIKGVLYEDLSKREESVKHFHLEDGSFVAAQYNYPVHVADEEGNLVDIDNSLFSGLFSSEYSTSNARIKFAKKITGNGTLFALHEGGTKLTLSLEGANKGTKGSVTNGEDAEESTELQKMMNLEKLSSKVLYEDILDGVDLEYVACSLNVKENIIVKERKTSYNYSFELKLNGLAAELLPSGDVSITDGEGKEKYRIPAPVTFDGANTHAPATASSYTLTKSGGGKYTLTVSVDSAWMNAEDRVFPVTIDPAVVAYNTQILDTYISPLTPSLTNSHSETLTIFSGSIAYFKIPTLPSLPKSAYIENAEIEIHTASDSVCYIGAYEVLTDWDGTITWNDHVNSSLPQGKLGNYTVDYNYIRYAEGYTWNITSLVKKWYSGANYGVAFKEISGYTASVGLISVENTENEYSRPYISIAYNDLSGVEDYFPMISQSAGRGGTSSINLATGNLTLATPTLSTTDYLYSYSPNLIYNFSKTDTLGQIEGHGQVYTGYGFTLSCISSITEEFYIENSVQKTKYKYVDSDGTVHYYYANFDGTYTDSDGMQTTMIVYTDEIFIYDQSGNYRYFVKYNTDVNVWTFYGYSDSLDSNWLDFPAVDDSENYRPASVFLSGYTYVAEMLTFHYDSDGTLKRIYNDATKEAALLVYSETYNGQTSSSANKYLRKILFAKGNENTEESDWEAYSCGYTNYSNITHLSSVSYVYDSSKRIAYVSDDIANKQIRFVWSGDKVVEVYEQHAGLIGQKISIFYGEGYTDVRSSGNDEILSNDDDIVTRYIFDSLGRSVNVYSASVDGKEIYGSVCGSYDDKYNSKNSIKESSSIGGSSQNYLINGDFSDGLAYWESYGFTAAQYSPTSYANTYYAKADLLHYSEATLAQYLTLESGTYTLSMPVRIGRADNFVGKVSVTSLTDDLYAHEEDIAINESYENGEYLFSTTFTLPDDLTTNKFKLQISFTLQGSVSDSPEISLDDLMLSKSLGAMSFNMLSYGGFDESLSTSEGGIGLSIVYAWETNMDAFTLESSDSISGKSIRVDSTLGSQNYVKQRIFGSESLCDYSHNKTYLVSGFAKAFDANCMDSPFRIRVEVAYLYDDAFAEDIMHEQHYLDFQSDCTDWQFVSKAITVNCAKYDAVKYIDVYLEYFGRPDGYALFDNVSVSSDNGDATTRYEYNDQGFVEYMSCGSYYEEYEYNSDNNLSKTTTSLGDVITYEYYSGTISEFVHKETYYHKNSTAINGLEPLTQTVYDYNSFGQKNSEITVAVKYNESGTAIVTDSSVPQYKYYASYEERGDSRIIGALKREMFSLEREKIYFYDENTGLLLAEVYKNDGLGYAYTYDDLKNLIMVKPAYYDEDTLGYIADSEGAVSYEWSANGNIEEIHRSATNYYLYYNAFGSMTEFSVADNTLATYEYNTHNGKLTKINYGNGFSEEYVYNDLEMLSEVWYTVDGVRSLALEYEYTMDGRLYRTIDHLNGKEHIYKYDSEGKLVSFADVDSETNVCNVSEFINYDSDDRVSADFITFSVPSSSGEHNYGVYYFPTYDENGRISAVNVSASVSYVNSEFTYDELGRLSRKNTNYSVYTDSYRDFIAEESYTYRVFEINRTDSLLDSYEYKVNGNVRAYYSYTYNSAGYITKIVDLGENEIRYYYDKLGQLVREDNELLRNTFVYEYDTDGNLLAKLIYGLTISSREPSNLIDVVNYFYSDSDWGDLLTSFNGEHITYDEIGNPLNYLNGFSFTWTGRKLTGATQRDNVYSFAYDCNGLRTSKTVNGVTTNYYWVGTQLIMEQTADETIVYIYDETGSVIGMNYRLASYSADQWDIYWFERNPLGDIVAVYNDLGTKLISYLYDAWGNAAISYAAGVNAISIPAKNPFRYRGYYYDKDLGLYYLQSRYYDPKIGRWINADSVISGVGGDIRGYNMFAYCMNNPVNMSDPTGNWPKWIKNTVKWIATNIVKPIVKTVQETLSQVDLTYSTGINVSGTPSAFIFNGQIGVSMDTKGNVAIQASGGAGVTGSDPSISITRYRSVTNAPNINKLNDSYYQIGGSIAMPIEGVPVAAGGDVMFMPDPELNTTYFGLTGNIGFGTPGKELHSEWGTTVTLPYTKFNIYDFAKAVYIKIMEW